MSINELRQKESPILLGYSVLSATEKIFMHGDMHVDIPSRHQLDLLDVLRPYHVDSSYTFTDRLYWDGLFSCGADSRWRRPGSLFLMIMAYEYFI